FLRPWLIEGRLAALGLIDRAAAEIELQPEALVWRGHYAVILTVAAYEGWVRTWEARLGRAA
ncbi:MAG: asparagine synthase, partial [Brevundimonas sp.]|nr:asparagine synthase [Brevundimonas sp.]